MLLVLGLCLAIDAREPARVQPTVETAAATGRGDVADDCCIWIHPADPSLSTLIGESKDDRGGLEVYDLAGKRIQFEPSGKMGNLDLRYNFPLAGRRVALVVCADRAGRRLVFYQVNPVSRMLEDVAGAAVSFDYEPYGGCLYHSPVTGRYYFFVNNKDGLVEQVELFDDGNGRVSGRVVRRFDVGTQVEGCVADDGLASFYVGEEDVGLWKYGAEPGDQSGRAMVDKVGAGGHLAADVEGMCIYYAGGRTGYLIVSSQGDSRHAVYRRAGDNAYIGDFTIVANGGIDEVTETDGCEVTNFPLGPAFPAGIHVAHDADNEGAASSNYKLVPWSSIAGTFSPGLTIDPSWDPRKIGNN